MPACRKTRLGVGFLAVAAALGVAATAAGGTIEIRRVDARGFPTVAVTVVAPSASPAPTLTEGGAAVAGLSAVNLGGQQSIVLLLDRSQSMHGKALADAVKAARAFIAAKPGPDQISVVAFGSQATTLSGFSNSGSDADQALQSLKVDQHYRTIMNDAVALAADSLRKYGLAGRVAILVTDGQETTSKATLVDTIYAARRAGVAVYTIAIPDLSFKAAPLQQLARETGGRYYLAPSTSALSGIYQAIGAELRRTWQLNYVTAARPGDTITLKVTQGAAAVTGTSRLSGDLMRAPKGDSSTFLLALMLVLGGGLSAFFIFQLRSSQPLQRWQRHDPDLY
jgi:Ca-activated chloride channel homolog